LGFEDGNFFNKLIIKKTFSKMELSIRVGKKQLITGRPSQRALFSISPQTVAMESARLP
jgi:hypothetical protein